MKKTYLFCIAVLAAFVTVSCSKEIINDNDGPQQANLVPMTFTADCEETKAILVDTEDASKKDVHWKSGDLISVLGQKTANQQFQATQSGQTTTFEGLAAAEDAKYYAVYPYQGDLKLDATSDATSGIISGVKVPSVQTAVEDSFDPNAYVWAAVSSAKSFTFKTFCALWKLTINDERASEIKSIVVKDNDGNYIASDAGKLTVSDDGRLSHTAENGVTTIKLLAPADGFNNGSSYFVALRPAKCEHGITMYIEYNDGSVYSKKNETALYPSTQTSYSGTIRGITVKAENFAKVTSRYEIFSIGCDVEIAGKIYNKSSWSESVSLITSSSSSKGLNNDGLYFIETDAGATMNSGKNIIAVGDKIGERAKLSRSGYSFIPAKYWVIDNIDLSISIPSNATYTYSLRLTANTDCEYLAINDCFVSVPVQQQFIYNNNSVAKVISITNSEFQFASASNNNFFQFSASAEISSINIDNNIFYTTDIEDGKTAGFCLASAQNVVVSDFKFNNNTFYGVQSTAHYTNFKTTSATINNNIFDIASSALTSSHIYVLGGQNSKDVTSSGCKYLYNGTGSQSVYVIGTGNMADSGNYIISNPQKNSSITSIPSTWNPTNKQFVVIEGSGASR